VTRAALFTSEESPAEVPSEKKVKSIMEVMSCREKCSVPVFLGLKMEEKTKFKMRNMSSGFKMAQM